jgi:hypothetical protein
VLRLDLNECTSTPSQVAAPSRTSDSTARESELGGGRCAGHTGGQRKR